MIPEIGQFALIMALALSVVLAIVPTIGAQRGNTAWMNIAPNAAIGSFVFHVVAFACLTYAFILKDFSVLYVARNSNEALPLVYRITAVWGAHEGSLLLWSMILSGWTLAVAIRSRHLPQAFSARVLGVLGFLMIGFLLFMLLTSNPFDRLFPAALRGEDLNPLLQDVGLIIHPPMLYMGYVGMAIPFAFAIAALLEGRIDAAWTRWTRPWTLLAWMFLTLGIALGSWWAYYELGWGGWWFWDPVENASFLPWLIATALIHSLAVAEKRNTFKAWTVLLAIFGFSLSLLGTFLVRSGVLVSVHAFASDPERGVFILAFLAVVIGGALTLFAIRASSVSSVGTFSTFSRETALLTNNVLLLVMMVTILLGTLYPLIMDGLNLGKISVGRPYFDLLFGLLMVPLAALLGFGPLVRWKRDQSSRFVAAFGVLAVISIVAGAAVVALMNGPYSVTSAIGLILAIWITLGVVRGIRERVRNRRNAIAGLFKLPLGFIGMSLAHLGVAVAMTGVVLVRAYDVETDVGLRPGEAVDVAGYQVRFDGITRTDGANYTADRGLITVTPIEGKPFKLYPEKRFYPIQAQPMTEAAIRAGFTHDIYVSLGESLGQDRWSLRIYYKPFIRWIWLGCIFMGLGGLLAALDRRYRARRRVTEPEPGPADTKGDSRTNAAAGASASTA